MVKLIASTDPGVRVCAAAARLSTKSGLAGDIFDASQGGERDQSLIKKVMSSGHRSLIEHQSFSFAMDEVSIFVEQCLIEFRLSSFTVKSRRYVDFKSAGYYTPSRLKGDMLKAYSDEMDSLFDDYAKLVDLGVPKEDARFVLPYCFYSSLYLTCNARELSHIIETFVYGRLSRYDEVRKVGLEMAELLEREYPGILNVNPRACRLPSDPESIASPAACEAKSSIIGKPGDAKGLLESVMEASGRFGKYDIKSVVTDARPRELEALSYTFKISDVSQSCVTHFARHRMQSPIFESPALAVGKNRYVLPESVAQNPQALEIYESAFKRNTDCARGLLEMGLDKRDLVYLSLSGNTLDMLITMNARELVHFMNLRTCERAQWEIRKVAGDMLSLLCDSFPELFRFYGPSCLMNGSCPEGRLGCGHPKKRAD